MRPNLSALRKQALAGNPEAIAALRDTALQAIAILDGLTDRKQGHPDIPEAIRAGVEAAHEVAERSLQWPVRWDAIQEIREPHLGKIHKEKKADGTGRIGRRGIGSKAGIRIEGRDRGRPRDFGPHGAAGFGLDVWQELEAERTNPDRRPHAADMHPELAADGVLPDERLVRTWEQLAAILPPLSIDSLELWVTAGERLCESWTHDLRIDDHPTIPGVKRVRRVPQWERFPWIDPIKNKAGETQVTLDGQTTQRGVKASIRGKVRESLRSLLP